MEDPETIRLIALSSAKFVYQAFLVECPRVDVEGLYTANNSYFIVCNNLDSVAAPLGFESLAHWFSRTFCPAAWPVDLATEIPLNSSEVVLTVADKSNSEMGRSLSANHYKNALASYLPGGFPDFRIKYSFNPRRLLVTTSRSLSEAEDSALEKAYCAVGYIGPLEKLVNEDPFDKQEDNRSNDSFVVLTRVSAAQQSKFSGEVVRLGERDQSLWSDAQSSMWTDECKEISCAPRPNIGARCLIDASLSPPPNFRSYLLIYDGVDLIMPLEGKVEGVMRKMGLSVEDFFWLLEQGCIRLILPQSLGRYSPTLLSEAVKRSLHAPVLSRELSLLSIQESRARMPLLYSWLGAQEKRALLRSFAGVANETNDKRVAGLFNALVESLSSMWQLERFRLSQSGALGISTGIGFGRIAADLIQTLVGTETLLGLTHAGQMVEWAGGLRAFPVPWRIGLSADSSLFLSYICNFYNPNHSVQDFEKLSEFKLSPVVERLFNMPSNIDVRTVVSARTSSEAERLRSFLKEAPLALNEPANQDVFTSLNKKVAACSKNKSAVARFELSGVRLGLQLQQPQLTLLWQRPVNRFSRVGCLILLETIGGNLGCWVSCSMS